MIEPDGIERLAEYLAQLHPAWRDRQWSTIGDEIRDLFRADARQAVAIYEGRPRAAADRVKGA